ncbi:MAG: hypothetical protein Q9162_002386 [Coniocarpon cinnabarinum]
MNAFIVGRAITGLGGSGTYLATVNIITNLTTMEEKGRYFGYIGFSWGFGTMLVQVTATLTTPEDRVLPVHVLLSGEMWLLVMEIGCPISMLFLPIYYIPLYFQFVRGETAVHSAVDLLPFLVTSVAAMLVSGRLIIFGYYKLWFVFGSLLALIMSICLYTIRMDTSHAEIYGWTALGGIGVGLYAMNAGPVMSAIVAQAHVADAGTIFACVDAITGSMSVGIANSIFINQATKTIQGILPNLPKQAVQDAITGVEASLSDQLPPDQRTAVVQAVLNAIRDVWVQAIATTALSLVLSLLLRNEKLKDRMSP